MYAGKNDIPIISLAIIAIKYSVKYFIDLPSSTRSSHRRCSVKNVFLKISQISQENTCARVSFLIKFQLEACNFIEKENLVQVFSCEVYEILRAPFLQNTFGGCFCTRNHYHQLLLRYAISNMINLISISSNETLKALPTLHGNLVKSPSRHLLVEN